MGVKCVWDSCPTDIPCKSVMPCVSHWVVSVRHWGFPVWWSVCVSVGQLSPVSSVSICQWDYTSQCQECHQVSVCNVTSDVKCVIMSQHVKRDIAHQRVSSVTLLIRECQVCYCMSSCVYTAVCHCASEWQGVSDCQMAPFHQNSVLWGFPHVSGDRKLLACMSIILYLWCVRRVQYF